MFSFAADNKNGVFGQNHVRLGKKTKASVGFAIIAVLLISVFAFLQTTYSNTSDGIPQSTDDPEPATSTPLSTPVVTPQMDSNNQDSNPTTGPDQSTSGSSSTSETTDGTGGSDVASDSLADNAYWMNVATTAWQYFQPGVGVDSKTGLPNCDSYYPYFTDWDLGVYIEAVMSAKNVGLITAEDAWGSSIRLEKVVTFLETRDLNNYSFPFWFYQSKDGKHYEAQVTSSPVDVIDEGRLFLALSNLKAFNSSLASRINNVVYHRSNFTFAVKDFRTDFSAGIASVYYYMAASGFERFWPNALNVTLTKILDDIYAQGTVTTYGVALPKASILCEPLLYLVFENKNDTRVTDLAYQVYLAHEAKYSATGEFVAYSEGNNGYGDFTYEWVVMPDGQTWKTWDSVMFSYSVNYPVVYTKVSFSFLALYNTTFAWDMSAYLQNSLPSSNGKGYYDGCDFQYLDSNRHFVLQLGSNTNGLILSAARYALQK